MIGLNAQNKFYLYSHHTDMRKSFDGLCGVVRNLLKRDPLDGDVYVFLNRDRSIIRMLVWDRTGYLIYSKRLEKGSFERPKSSIAEQGTNLTFEELVLIMEGIHLSSVRRRKRYERPLPQTDSTPTKDGTAA